MILPEPLFNMQIKTPFLFWNLDDTTAIDLNLRACLTVHYKERKRAELVYWLLDILATQDLAGGGFTMHNRKRPRQLYPALT